MSGDRKDQGRAPLLDALADYRRQDRYGFSPPGHRQGRGADPRALDVLGDACRSDVLSTGGLDDRLARDQYLSDAEDLMADAVGAEHAFFSTCGSSLSVQLQIVEAAVGAPPLPVHEIRVPTRLADEVQPDGSLSVAGADRAANAVATAVDAAYRYGVDRPSRS